MKNVYPSFASSLVLSALLLAGCGGGGGSGTASSPSSTLSGTAAGGAAVVGNVIVTDSAGATVSAPIEANGHYTVDVSGMTSPFVLKAVGTVGNASVTYYSAATTADVNGTVNVTPFTNLILSNIAGQLAENYFSTTNPDFSVIRANALADAQSALATKLAPVLQAMGLTDSIDLLRTSFAADHSGIDAVLDVIKVETSGNTATLKNALTNAVLATDDVSTHVDDTDAATPDIALNGTVVTNLQALQNKLDSFAALFATGLPSVTQLENTGLFDMTSFMDNGLGFAQWATETTTDSTMIGIAFRNVAVSFDSETTGTITFIAHDANGVTDTVKLRMAMMSGGWKLLGNGTLADMNIEALSIHQITTNNSSGNVTTDAIQNGLQMWLDPFAYNSSHLTQQITSAVVTGPGLPGAGVNMVSQAQARWFLVQGTYSNEIPECTGGVVTQCVTIADTLDNAEYTIVLKDAGGNSLNGAGDTLILPKQAIATSQLATAMFPTATAMTVNGMNITDMNQLVANASVGVSWTMPSGFSVEFVSGTVTGTGAPNYLNVEKDILPSATSTTLGFGSDVPTGVTGVGFWLRGSDSAGHAFATSYWRY